jgi:hypothetical protein
VCRLGREGLRDREGERVTGLWSGVWGVGTTGSGEAVLEGKWVTGYGSYREGEVCYSFFFLV